MMPNLDGLSACAAIRAQADTAGIPIIMVTTRGEEHNIERAFRNGCTDYVTKPINGLELLTKLQNILGRAAGGGIRARHEKNMTIQRPLVEKAANDTREYLQSLFDENQSLKQLVAELEFTLSQRESLEAMLKRRVAAIEEESRHFSERYFEVEQQNTNLANLYVASYQLNGTLDRERIVAAIQEIVINLVGCEELAIWEVDEDFGVLGLVGSFGIEPTPGRPCQSARVIGAVASTGERFIAGESGPAAGREDRTHRLHSAQARRPRGRCHRHLPPSRSEAGLEPLDFELFDLLASHAATALVCTRGAGGQAGGMTMGAYALRDAELVRERRFVQPGQVFVTATPTAVTTILGSCVAVCVWDGQRRIGGVNHFMLPFSTGSAARSTRFGNVAMEELFEQVKSAGARLPFLRAFVFGGSCMFAGMQQADHLGQKNADLAIDLLTRRGVEIAQVDVGGNRGRKVVFYTDEGSVCLKTI